MPAPTVQQIRQMQQESPTWQQSQKNKQQEEMYRQKWQGIFSNVQLCERYVKGDFLVPMIKGTGSDKTIQVPEDPTERKVAQEVAQNVMQTLEKNTAAPNKVGFLAEGAAVADSEVIYFAAKKFVRACNVYTKRQSKGDTKEVNKFQKENPGVGTYSQGQLIPMSNNTVDMFNAGTNAGKQAAQYYMTSDQTSQDNLAKQIKQYMQDKCYNTCFWYTFYSSIKPHDNDTLAIQKQRLDYLKPIYNQYESIANPKTMSERQKTVTAKQAYTDMANQQGRR